MKTLKSLTAVAAALAVLLAGAMASAQDGKKDRGDRGDRGKRAKVLERFDKDGDGKLNEEERAAAKEAFEQFRGKRGQEDGGKPAPEGRGEGRKDGPKDAWPGVLRGHCGTCKCCEAIRARLLEQFDANGNGKLDPDEVAAAKQAAQERHQQKILEKFDANGNGVIDEDEKAAMEAAREQRRKEMMAKFDKNGDGELSKGEREAMRNSRSKGGTQSPCGCPKKGHKDPGKPKDRPRKAEPES